jgi:dTMP kinase
MFISFEGIDGSGKTTQAKLLYEALSGERKCVLTREPTQGDIGNFIKRMIKAKRINPTAVQLLFAADRSFHTENLIKPKLRQGYTVITDRYSFSTIAYGRASGIDEDWLKEVNGRFLKPDITFVLDINPRTAIKRISSRRKDAQYFERLKFLQATRRVFKKLAKEYNCNIIDGSKDIDTIKEEILSIVK